MRLQVHAEINGDNSSTEGDSHIDADYGQLSKSYAGTTDNDIERNEGYGGPILARGSVASIMSRGSTTSVLSSSAGSNGRKGGRPIQRIASSSDLDTYRREGIKKKSLAKKSRRYSVAASNGGSRSSFASFTSGTGSNSSLTARGSSPAALGGGSDKEVEPGSPTRTLPTRVPSGLSQGVTAGQLISMQEAKAETKGTEEVVDLPAARAARETIAFPAAPAAPAARDALVPSSPTRADLGGAPPARISLSPNGRLARGSAVSFAEYSRQSRASTKLRFQDKQFN